VGDLAVVDSLYCRRYGHESSFENFIAFTSRLRNVSTRGKKRRWKARYLVCASLITKLKVFKKKRIGGGSQVAKLRFLL
jgi:hypothetical protein